MLNFRQSIHTFSSIVSIVSIILQLVLMSLDKFLKYRIRLRYLYDHMSEIYIKSVKKSYCNIEFCRSGMKWRKSVMKVFWKAEGYLRKLAFVRSLIILHSLCYIQPIIFFTNLNFFYRNM